MADQLDFDLDWSAPLRPSETEPANAGRPSARRFNIALAQIALYWQNLPTLGVVFSKSADWDWNLGPFCFRCGWWPPVHEWDEAHGYLERAHLWDHAYGGPELASNLVPLCCACHDFQPTCTTREAGIRYVNDEVRAPAEADIDPEFRHAEPSRRREAYWRNLALNYQRSLAIGEHRDDPQAWWPQGDTKRDFMRQWRADYESGRLEAELERAAASDLPAG